MSDLLSAVGLGASAQTAPKSRRARGISRQSSTASLLESVGIATDKTGTGSFDDLFASLGITVESDPLAAPGLNRIMPTDRTPRAVLDYIARVEGIVNRMPANATTMERPDAGPAAPATDRIVRESIGVLHGPITRAQHDQEFAATQRLERKNQRLREEKERERKARGGTGSALGTGVLADPSAMIEREYRELDRMVAARPGCKTIGQKQSNTLWIKRILRRLISLGESVDQIAEHLK